ncbi:hypothetical protein CEXT_79351 [Caerostris extrusa]|uniref:Uncharacterized protein n=1 Tax=Caerostris extrusa TaxID=172846 RepID=A0AAV4PP03_CAEEX|nr:hypothetical protein CEXT_79351 [Caerostris extrusa]
MGTHSSPFSAEFQVRSVTSFSSAIFPPKVDLRTFSRSKIGSYLFFFFCSKKEKNFPHSVSNFRFCSADSANGLAAKGWFSGLANISVSETETS